MRILVYSTCQEDREVEWGCERNLSEERVRSRDLLRPAQSSPARSPWQQEAGEQSRVWGSHRLLPGSQHSQCIFWFASPLSL